MKKLLRFFLSPKPELLREALEELGGAFVKIGQLLSTRVDILPPEYIRELEKLQDEVPPQPLEELLSAYPELRNFFKKIEETPIGSGSIAQVHKAYLKDGTEVAVKIVRPQARALIKRDVRLLKIAARTVALLYPPFKDFRLPQIAAEFERMLLEELDLSREAAYMELFRKFSSEEPSLYVPRVYWQYSSKDYLTSEFINGEKLTKASFKEEEREEMAKRFVHIVHRTIFELGVFHADLHPGNIFVLDGGRFAFVDFGIVGRLSPETLDEFFFYSLGVMLRDVELIVDSLRKIGALPDGINERLLKREILVFLDKYYNKPLSQIDAQKLFYEELSTARRFKIVLPEELVLLMKTIAHTESIARMIYPDFRLPPILKPYLTKLAPKFVASTVKRRVWGEVREFLSSERKGREERVERGIEKSLFWGLSLIGGSIVLSSSPKFLPLYLLALLLVKEKTFNRDKY